MNKQFKSSEFLANFKQQTNSFQLATVTNTENIT